MPVIQNINLASYQINNNQNKTSFEGRKRYTNYDPNYKPSKFKKFLGFIGGSMTNSFVGGLLIAPLTFGFLHVLKNYKELPEKEVTDAAGKMAKEAGLDKLKLVFVNKDNSKALSKIIYREIIHSINKSPIARFQLKLQEGLINLFTKTPGGKIIQDLNKSTVKELPFMKGVIKKLSNLLVWMVEKGWNAFCITGANTIAAPQHRASLIFHEIGHAINANSSKFLKHYQSISRKIPKWVALPVGLVALLHTNTKPKNGQEKSGFIKLQDFIKDNIGKITFLSFLPMISEEALASARGIKFVQKTFGPAKASKIAALYTMALGSYIGGAAISAIALKAGSKTRDKIVYPEYMRTNP